MQAVVGRPRMRVRLARGLGLDGNPLRRGSDRAEAWVRAVLLAAFVAAGPVAAVAAGGWVSHLGTEMNARASQVHSVDAVLLPPAGAAISPVAVDGRGSQVWVKARWEGAGGSTQTGEVPAPAGSPAGRVVTVWLDASGRVTGPPLRGQFATNPALAAVMALIGVALALLVALKLTRRFLDRRRLAAWEAAWSAIGPRWTGRRSLPCSPARRAAAYVSRSVPPAETAATPRPVRES
jgi:hypothetical protein